MRPVAFALLAGGASPLICKLPGGLAFAVGLLACLLPFGPFARVLGLALCFVPFVFCRTLEFVASALREAVIVVLVGGCSLTSWLVALV